MANGITLPPILQDRRVQIGGGVGILLIILIVIGMMAFGPKKEDYGDPKLLLKGIDQVRAIDISAYLKENNIHYVMEQGETGGVNISVGEKQYDAAVIRLAGNQITKADDLKLFDKTDWAASDEERRIKYIRAISGEISRVISRMEGVESATVHMNIPPRKIFQTTADIASASVSLRLRPGRLLSNEQVKSIISIIRGYYAEIPENHIAITDEERGYSTITDDAANSNSNAETQNVEQDTIQTRVQGYLDSLFGAGNTTAAVSISMQNAYTVRNNTRFMAGAVGNVSGEYQGPSGTAAYAQHAAGISPLQPTDTPVDKNTITAMPTVALPVGTVPAVSPTASTVPQIYRCSPSDPSCPRNGIKTGYDVQAYPSYEQEMVEMPSGYVKDVKVSVILDPKVANGVSLDQLRRSIAAAADPNITENNVEIILRPTTVANMTDEEADKKFGKGSSGIGQVIWWLCVILIIIVGGSVLFGVIRNMLNKNAPNPRGGYDPYSGYEQQAPQPVYTPSNTGDGFADTLNDFGNNYTAPVSDTGDMTFDSSFDDVMANSRASYTEPTPPPPSRNMRMIIDDE